MTHNTTQRDINATERARQALNLRKQGYTLEEIAKQCGYQDKSGAYRAIKRELDRVIIEEVEDLRKLEALRYDVLLKACMGKAEKGDIRAIEVAIQLADRRAKLTGLDKRPEEELVNQNYEKKIVIQHAEENDGSSND